MIIPDANLLLYAYDKESPFHKESARWWSKLLSGHEPVGLCSVVVFSFLRLTTHPKVFIHPYDGARSHGAGAGLDGST